jgi:hypothetical protein
LKYFWAVLSFGGVLTSDCFAKCYELHYQLKKVKANRATLTQQFGCVNFLGKRYRGSGPKLTVAVKYKWEAGWMMAWFHCKVLVHVCP